MSEANIAFLLVALLTAKYVALGGQPAQRTGGLVGRFVNGLAPVPSARFPPAMTFESAAIRIDWSNSYALGSSPLDLPSILVLRPFCCATARIATSRTGSSSSATRTVA